MNVKDVFERLSGRCGTDCAQISVIVRRDSISGFHITYPKRSNG
jgi:hypothetical protein